MSYDARNKEALEALDKTDFDPAAKEKIRAALDSYFRQREGYMENLLDALDPDRSGPCHSQWLDKAKGATAMVLEAFKSAEAGKLWLATLANEELAFFYQIQMSRVPVQRDKMMQQAEKLRAAMQEFDNKWQKIKDGDADLENRLKSIAQQYEQILQATAHVAAQTEKETKEKVIDTVKQVLTIGLSKVDLGAVAYGLKAAASAIGVKLNEAQARKLEIFALNSLEEQVFATFKETRVLVKDFLQENGYPAIKDGWDDGNRAAEELQGGMTTAGQKSDAAAFGSAIKDKLQKVFSVAEREYKEFARKNEYLLFGPLGSGYYTELMEDDTWKQYSENWKRLRADFDDLLRERTFEENPDKILEVSLEGISEEDGKRIYDQLKGAMSELLQAWNKWKEFTNDPYWILSSREQMKSILNALR